MRRVIAEVRRLSAVAEGERLRMADAWTIVVPTPDGGEITPPGDSPEGLRRLLEHHP